VDCWAAPAICPGAESSRVFFNRLGVILNFTPCFFPQNLSSSRAYFCLEMCSVLLRTQGLLSAFFFFAWRFGPLFLLFFPSGKASPCGYAKSIFALSGVFRGPLEFRFGVQAPERGRLLFLLVDPFRRLLVMVCSVAFRVSSPLSLVDDQLFSPTVFIFLLFPSSVHFS